MQERIETARRMALASARAGRNAAYDGEHERAERLFELCRAWEVERQRAQDGVAAIGYSDGGDFRPGERFFIYGATAHD